MQVETYLKEQGEAKDISKVLVAIMNFINIDWRINELRHKCCLLMFHYVHLIQNTNSSVIILSEKVCLRSP